MAFRALAPFLCGAAFLALAIGVPAGAQADEPRLPLPPAAGVTRRVAPDAGADRLPSEWRDRRAAQERADEEAARRRRDAARTMLRGEQEIGADPPEHPRPRWEGQTLPEPRRR